MTTESFLLDICALSLTALWLIAIVRGLLEMFGGPGARARESDGIDWWVLAPFALALALPISWLVGLYVFPGQPATFHWADLFGNPEALIFDLFTTVGAPVTIVWGPAILLMVVIPIVHAFRSRTFYLHLYLLGVLGILAMPFALISFGTFLEREMAAGHQPQWAQMWDGHYGTFGRFGLRDETPHCTESLMQRFALRRFEPKAWSAGRDIADQVAQLWLNDTFNTMSFDVPAAFGCELSQIEPNPNYFPAAATLGFYRAFVSLVMLGMILRPFARRALLARDYSAAITAAL